MTWTEYEQQLIENRRAYDRAYYQANRERIRQRHARRYKRAAEPRRDQRREQTRQAVEELLKTRHSVREMVQVAFEANGGNGDAGARVLGKHEAVGIKGAVNRLNGKR